MSSPSRPASQALTTSETSARRMRRLSVSNCRALFSMTSYFQGPGTMGKSSCRHLA